MTHKKSTAREYFESIVIAVILALFIRTWVVQAFKIPTGSMENNLLVGDHLLVDKFVFAPAPTALERALLPVREVKRGDVIVFKYPMEPERDFIKRVIGLPGETVEIRNKEVFVDGKALTEPYAHFIEAPLKPGDPEYREPWESGKDNWGPHVVPSGRVLVLGDNRDNSRDGRFWSDPFLPIDQVKGRALLVYWSYEATREEYHRTGVVEWVRDTLSAFGRTRWKRFFHVIR